MSEVFKTPAARLYHQQGLEQGIHGVRVDSPYSELEATRDFTDRKRAANQAYLVGWQQGFRTYQDSLRIRALGSSANSAHPLRKFSRAKVALLAIFASYSIAFSALAADLRSKFDQVSIGLTRQAVTSLMGAAPTSTQESSVLGVSTVKLRWDESVLGPVYEVTFVFDRCVATKVCDRRNEC